MHSQFVNRINPWTQQKMTKSNKPAASIVAAELEICNDPLPTRRINPDGKYSAVFDKMKLGQCIKCPTGNAGRRGQALRKWIEQKKLPYRVSTAERYELDGLGRVWLLPKLDCAGMGGGGAGRSKHKG